MVRGLYNDMKIICYHKSTKKIHDNIANPATQDLRGGSDGKKGSERERERPRAHDKP